MILQEKCEKKWNKTAMAQFAQRLSGIAANRYSQFN